jgi:hypothetical protein
VRRVADGEEDSARIAGERIRDAISYFLKGFGEKYLPNKSFNAESIEA